MSVCKNVDQSSPSLSVHSLVHSFIGSFLGSLIQSFIHSTRITGPLPYAGTAEVQQQRKQGRSGPVLMRAGRVRACIYSRQLLRV